MREAYYVVEFICSYERRGVHSMNHTFICSHDAAQQAHQYNDTD
jgi:hypothetical protein